MRLYSTEHCHLCDEALDVIYQALSGTDCQIQVVDIVSDDALMDRYALRIPVLASQDDRELDWPFSVEAVRQFLQKTNN